MIRARKPTRHAYCRLPDYDGRERWFEGHSGVRVDSWVEGDAYHLAVGAVVENGVKRALRAYRMVGAVEIEKEGKMRRFVMAERKVAA